jgi:hypothetical protein
VAVEVDRGNDVRVADLGQPFREMVTQLNEPPGQRLPNGGPVEGVPAADRRVVVRIVHVVLEPDLLDPARAEVTEHGQVRPIVVG